jgi:excisionase family DNA binding protein
MYVITAFILNADRKLEYMNHNETTTEKNARLLTPNEVAEHLQVTAEQVRSLIRKGQLAACNAGTGKKRPLYRITQQALDDFMNRRRQPCPAPNRQIFRQLAPAPDFFPGLK